MFKQGVLKFKVLKLSHAHFQTHKRNKNTFYLPTTNLILTYFPTYYFGMQKVLDFIDYLFNLSTYSSQAERAQKGYSESMLNIVIA